MRALKRASKLRRNSTFVEFYNARASRNDSPPVSIDGTDRPGHKWGANVHQVGFCCLRCSVGTELTCLIRMANSPLLKRSSSQWCNNGITSATSIVWVKLYLQATLGGIQKYT